MIFRVGQAVRFRYPTANYVGVALRWEVRTVRIETILGGPAPREAVERDPLLRRGGTLIVGVDLHKHERRSFYAASMRDVEEVEALPETDEVYRIVLIDQAGRESVPAPCLPSIDARACIEAWNDRTHRHGFKAEARELRLPGLVRDASGKVE